MNRPRRRALSRWRRRRRYQRRLAIATEFTLLSSMLIDRRLVVLEAAA